MIRHIATNLGASLTVIVFLFAVCVSPGYAQSDTGLTGPPISLRLNLAAEASVNDIVTATVTAYDADGNSVDFTPYVTLSSDSPDIVLPLGDATLGCVGGVGTATVTASFDNLTVSQQFRTNNGINSSGPLQIISLYPKATNLKLDKQPNFTPGEKRQMLVYCTDGAGAEISGLCTFSMGDETIAKVQAAPDQNAPPPGEVEGVSYGETTLTATAGSLTGVTQIAVAESKKILSPVAVLQNTGGDFSPQYSIQLTIDHSGLSFPFQSGVTDFDDYLSQDPTQSAIAALQEWFSPDGVHDSTIIYDLGASYVIDRIALWNEETCGIEQMTVDTSDNPAFANFTTVGSFNPRNNPYIDGNTAVPYTAEALSVTPTAARYVRLTVTGPQQPALSDSVSMGEIAFSVTPVTPPGAARLIEKMNPFYRMSLSLLTGAFSDFGLQAAPALATRLKTGPMIPLKKKTAISATRTRPLRLHRVI